MFARWPATAVPSDETEPANSRVAPPVIEAVTPVPTLGAPIVGAKRSVPSSTEMELVSPSDVPPSTSSMLPPHLMSDDPPARFIAPARVIGPEPAIVSETACPPSPTLPVSVSGLVELLVQVCEAASTMLLAIV